MVVDKEWVLPHLVNRKNYWKELLGQNDSGPLIGLSTERRDMVKKLSKDQQLVWHELETEERESFFNLDGNQSKIEYLRRKKLEMRNRAVESI